MRALHFFILFPVLLLLGCATTSNVMYDYDETINFNAYNTFVICIDDLFVENTKFPNYDNNQVRQLIADEFEHEMERLKHKTNVFDPQLQVGFRLIVKEEQTTFTNCDKQEAFEYWENCTIRTETYTKETLIAYVSDFKKNQIIWQASIPCDFNKSKASLKKHVKEVVKALFDQYPKVI